MYHNIADRPEAEETVYHCEWSIAHSSFTLCFDVRRCIIAHSDVFQSKYITLLLRIAEYSKLQGDSIGAARSIAHCSSGRPLLVLLTKRRGQKQRRHLACFEWIVIRWVQQSHFAGLSLKNNVKACFGGLRSHGNERKISVLKRSQRRVHLWN